MGHVLYVGLCVCVRAYGRCEVIVVYRMSLDSLVINWIFTFVRLSARVVILNGAGMYEKEKDPVQYSNTNYCREQFVIQYVPGGKVNILEDHSKKKGLYEHVSCSERFPISGAQ
jgi:hypothetical protein